MTVFDETYKAITDALDRLGADDRIKKRAKTTAVNVALEAGISKATLYRYFKTHEKLRGDYDVIRKRAGRRSIEAPGTLQEAWAAAQTEIRELRRQLSEAEVAAKLKAQQVLLLWAENKSLRSKVKHHSGALLL